MESQTMCSLNRHHLSKKAGSFPTKGNYWIVVGLADDTLLFDVPYDISPEPLLLAAVSPSLHISDIMVTCMAANLCKVELLRDIITWKSLPTGQASLEAAIPPGSLVLPYMDTVTYMSYSTGKMDAMIRDILRCYGIRDENFPARKYAYGSMSSDMQQLK